MRRPSLIVYSRVIKLPIELRETLQKEYELFSIRSLTALKALIERNRPHALMVLVGHQEENALEFLKGYKGHLPFGLMVLSEAYEAELERESFHLGADHFLLLNTVSTSIAQRTHRLVHRMEQLRHSQDSVILPIPAWRNGFLKLSGFSVDSSSELILYNEIPLNLTPLQAKLLICFIQQPNQIIHRTDLRRLVWKEKEISDRSIDAHIAKLRKSVPALQNALKGVYGRGYMLVTDELMAAG